MKKVLTFICIATLTLTSCSRNYDKSEESGVLIHRNKNIQSGKVEKLAVTKCFSINFEEDESKDSLRALSFPVSIELDNSDNVYILDQKKCSVKKFSAAGDFIKSFGQNGNGPGEFINPRFLVIKYDTLAVVDQRRYVYSKFTTDGEFIVSSDLSKTKISSIFLTKDDNYIGMVNGFKEKSDGLYNFLSLGLYNKSFKLIKEISVKEQKEDHKQNLIMFPDKYTSDRENIYFSPSTKDKYEITIFDYKGNLKEKIINQFMKIEYTAEENNLEREKFKKYNLPEATIMQIFALRGKYKDAINKLFVDYDGNLFVDRADMMKTPNYVFDVFRNGQLLKRVEVPILRTNEISLKNNRFISIDHDLRKIQIFTYKI